MTLEGGVGYVGLDELNEVRMGMRDSRGVG